MRFKLVRRVAVLADDFTGAVDVALAFAGAGFVPEVHAPAGPPAAGPAPSTTVWVMDTESRGLPPARAARAVGAALDRLARWAPDVVFKKIDSTLRGPWGAELGVLLARFPDLRVTVAPAFPRLGRTTRDGRQYVDGVLLTRTPFGRDPRHPARTARVADLIGLPAGQKHRVWVPDVTTERDLARAARQTRALWGGGVGVCAGSAGFAAALGRCVSAGRARPRRRAHIPRAAGPVGVVVGSAHPVSHCQADVMLGRLGHRGRSQVSMARAPRDRGRPDRVLNTLMESAARLERARRIRRWIATGGETAFALACRWKLGRWKIAAAVEPGIALCRSMDDPARWLVAKPGGFGGPSALWKAWRLLAGSAGRKGDV